MDVIACITKWSEFYLRMPLYIKKIKLHMLTQSQKEITNLYFVNKC